jgi:hypothetical protein
MIEKAFFHGQWHYNLESIGDIVCKEAGPCQIRLLLPQVDYKVVNEKWMRQKDTLKFLDWYAETMPSYEYTLNNIAKAVRSDQKKSRAVARKYRWHIAHRQKYSCLHCKELLHPDAMDIDHVEELRAGGVDELHNLCALCSNCHAKKTRSYYR